MSKDSSNKEKYSLFSFFNFFSRWLILGVFFILISCILSLAWPPFKYEFLRELIPNVLQTIGIAFLLGAIFDFSKNSQDFTEFISSLLSNIVISKTFLSKLDNKGKSEALSLILQSQENEIEQNSRIDDYFKKKIDDVMKMWDTNFKTNLSINIQIYKDNIVKTRGTLTYRVYKIKEKYEDIITMFDYNDSDNPDDYKIHDSKIIHPDGVYPINTDNSNEDKIETSGKKYKKYTFKVPDELYKYPYLTISRDINEKGYDHWTTFNWRSLTPYDGLNFQLKCDNGLIIKKHFTFSKKTSYEINIKNQTEMSIISTDWLEANTGFCIIIGEP